MGTVTNRTVWVYRPVLKFLAVEASTQAPLETGGVLMGYFGKSENTPVILWATRAGSQADHGRDYYRPDCEFDESQIATMYKRSHQQISYLGDWHTHPAPCARLSHRDKRALRRIAVCKSARVGTPLMLVLSYDGQWDVAVWQGKVHKSCRCIWLNRFSTTQLTIRLFSEFKGMPNLSRTKERGNPEN